MQLAYIKTLGHCYPNRRIDFIFFSKIHDLILTSKKNSILKQIYDPRLKKKKKAGVVAILLPVTKRRQTFEKIEDRRTNTSGPVCTLMAARKIFG